MWQSVNEENNNYYICPKKIWIWHSGEELKAKKVVEIL